MNTYESHLSVTDQGKTKIPLVTSSDPNQRKLARRIRIQQCLDALSKRDGGPTEEIVEKTPVEKQILASTSLLDKLGVEGDEVVSCVRIANDARELQRRKEDQEIRKRLLQKLEEEDNQHVQKYREIAEKWPEILCFKNPLDIHAEMGAQNVKCLEMLAKKDAVIAELREELEGADLRFDTDRKKQNEDIDLLIERMEKQLQIMARAYRRELLSIENVIESERKVLLETAMEEWESLHQKFQEDSRAGMERRKEIMHEYEEEIMRAMIEHQEEYRAQKISFELEIQNLQQEVENMKALCLMNAEKLDYSYAVLKHREEENIIIKNQQKRRINKLQDVANELKRNYAEVQESTRVEIQMLTDQVLKAYKCILDLEKKSDHFTVVNDRKYMQIWDMNTKNANKLLDKILTADKIIHEQALGLEWQPPEMGLLKKEDLPSYRAVLLTLQNEKLKAEQRKAIPKPYNPASTLEEINLERRLLNHIIKQVSNECGYLLETNLHELLAQYTEEDKLIIRLDSVFQALRVKTEEELRYLLSFFLPYAYCPSCVTKSTSRTSSISSEEPTKESSPSLVENVCPDVFQTDEEFNEAEARLVAAVKETVVPAEKLQDDNDVCLAGSTPCSSATETLSSPDVKIPSPTSASAFTKPATEESEVKERLLCDKGHPLEIETALVTRALREFIERYDFLKADSADLLIRGKYRHERTTVSRNVTVADVTEFWKRYRDVFSEDREKLWDVLLAGLKKYYEVLKERHRLNVETESLRKQNTELCRLLRTCMVEVVHFPCIRDVILKAM